MYRNVCDYIVLILRANNCTRVKNYDSSSG